METTKTPFTLDLQFRGHVIGSTIKSKSTGNELCSYFGGIPYALPPVGPFRWKQPRALPPCYRYGPQANPGVYNGSCGVCPQMKRSTLDDEDCLQLNIWIPAGEKPEEGWPVYFWIHGGFLQLGTANDINPAALLSETPFKAIVVSPAYRLNIYGFLASKELLTEDSNRSGTVGNLGFWDLRMALTWTYTNINYFGGNPSNITVGGYSAGSHCVFYQLAYDLDYPPEKRVIKRVVMMANGPGVQPKSLDEQQEQFDELLNILHISTHIPAAEKLRILRQTSRDSLRKAIGKMKLSQFKATTDGIFVKPTLFQELQDGTFARKLVESKVHVFIGESELEHFCYGAYLPPANNPEALYQRLLADYPRWAVDVLKEKYFSDSILSKSVRTWRELFGRIYADVQIHSTERGFIDCLCRHGAKDLVHRYRINWRSELSPMPVEWGATHAADMVAWWWGNGKVLPEKEKTITMNSLLGKYAKFVKGEEMDWRAGAPLDVRRLRSDGGVDTWKDEWWDEKLDVWNAMQEASAKQERAGKKANL